METINQPVLQNTQIQSDKTRGWYFRIFHPIHMFTPKIWLPRVDAGLRELIRGGSASQSPTDLHSRPA